MRIVYCVPSLYKKGGYEKVIIYKANYLAELPGMSVEIVAYNQSDYETAYPLSRQVKLTLSNLDIYFSTCGTIDVLISTFYIDSRKLYKVECAKCHIQEIHCSVERYIWFAHNILRRIYAYFQIKRDIFISRNYDCTVLLTEQERQLYWGREKGVVVIPNPLTLQEHGLSELKDKRVLAVGRISYQKGFDLLIKAWRLVINRFPDWHLDIMGSQEEPKEVRKINGYIQQYKLENVRLLPAVSDIATEYEHSAFLVMSSRYEGFGLVLTEAMACGLPCVAFDCHSGPRDIITDGVDGYLVAQNNIEGLANAMMDLMYNPAKRCQMGMNAQKKAQEYDIHQIMNKWMSLFSRLMANS